MTQGTILKGHSITKAKDLCYAHKVNSPEGPCAISLLPAKALTGGRDLGAWDHAAPLCCSGCKPFTGDHIHLREFSQQHAFTLNLHVPFGNSHFCIIPVTDIFDATVSPVLGYCSPRHSKAVDTDKCVCSTDLPTGHA